MAPTDIYYTWQREVPLLTTAPALLTTYEPPASTYRTVSVPLPKTARAGEKWRLGLSTGGKVDTALLDLAASRVPVLGVWSEGIELRKGERATGAVRGVAQDKPKGRRKDDKPYKDKAKEVPKQTRISRSWPLPGEEKDLTLVEQTSFDLDKVGEERHADGRKYGTRGSRSRRGCGRGGRGGTPILLHSGSLSSSRRGMKGRYSSSAAGRGWFPSHCRCSTRRSRSPRRTSVGAGLFARADTESAMEIMRENIALNRVDVAAEVLDWDAPPDKVDARVVVAADVTYNSASFPALVSTLDRLLLAKGHPPLLLAYKQRDAAERGLWEMLRARGIGSVLVDRVAGAGGDDDGGGDGDNDDGDDGDNDDNRNHSGQVEIWVLQHGI